jgi:hypothetical protein
LQDLKGVKVLTLEISVQYIKFVEKLFDVLLLKLNINAILDLKLQKHFQIIKTKTDKTDNDESLYCNLINKKDFTKINDLFLIKLYLLKKTRILIMNS